VEQKGKTSFESDFQYEYDHESMACRSFRPSEFESRGVRKVTTRITALWQPSIHSDVAF
jgi:hypothetical protein